MIRWHDEKHDLTIILLALPNNVDEVLTLNDDSSYTAFINEKRSPACQIRAYNHALEHILNDDFQEGNVQKIERKRHEEEKK